jgi:ABC-type lipoprotein export system ATPase subunit
MKTSGKYNFIQLKRVIIRNFSLYKKNGQINEINESINNGVFCLAGANGLGKTTFLNAINYGLTGIVLAPNKEVYTPDTIIDSNKEYTKRYFEGKIKATEKEKAEIELLLMVNSKFIRIIRSFDNREGLRLFEFYEEKNNKKYQLFKKDTLNQIGLLEAYEQTIVSEVGLGKFSYFMFFQLYILTFDENRRLLFWDNRASTNALSIAFNDNLEDTERMLTLKKRMEEYESYGRNARWQATQIKNEIGRLINTSKQQEDSGYKILKEEYDKMINDVENLEEIYNEINVEYDTLLKRQNILNSEILQLKTNYRKLFSLYSEPRSSLINNPYVQLSKQENKCFLCGSEGHQIIENIEQRLYSLSVCPACGTAINNEDEKEQGKLMSKIKKIDKDLDSKNTELEELIFESEIKKAELDKKYIELNRIKSKLAKFEKENKNISFTKTGEIPIDTLIEEYQKQYDKNDKSSIDYYAKRDKLAPEYRALQEKVKKEYKNRENIFVPLFKKFAFSFIGLDLNIFSKIKGRNIALYFELQNTARTAPYQLSESQRFFLDIALRMTLVIHLSKGNNAASLLIDTPEGSLDIAYENRVGRMFAEFVKEFNQNIVMTANINASQLLISLAEQCGGKDMEFKRMLEWTDFSEIQREGEYLFNRVYKNIEKKLRGN